MAHSDEGNANFDDIDTNQDGVIDRREFQVWRERVEGSGPFSSSAQEYSYEENTNDSLHLVPLHDSYLSSARSNDSYGEVIRTSSSRETNDYLSRMVSNVYNDPNPQIIRRAAIDGPRRYEQRIVVRFLRPPTPPPPGPLIIEERRAPQPPAPVPLTIHERAPSPPPPPPIILREQPPLPPPHIPSETKVVVLPPTPVPQRSAIVKRFPAAPERPRDILIERWLPYGPAPQRQTIVRSAPPAIKYAEPKNTIEIYENVRIDIIRKFNRFDAKPENPDEYVRQYGGSLLEPATLVQKAREAGVYEDISPPIHSSLT